MATVSTEHTAPNQSDRQSSIMVDANATARGVLLRLAGARGDLSPAEVQKWRQATTLEGALRTASEMRPDLPHLKTILANYTADTSPTKDAAYIEVIMRLHGQAGFYSDKSIGDMYHTAHAYNYGGTGSTDSPETLPGTGKPSLYFTEDLKGILPDSNVNPLPDSAEVIFLPIKLELNEEENKTYVFTIEDLSLPTIKIVFGRKVTVADSPITITKIGGAVPRTQDITSDEGGYLVDIKSTGGYLLTVDASKVKAGDFANITRSKETATF